MSANHQAPTVCFKKKNMSQLLFRQAFSYPGMCEHFCALFLSWLHEQFVSEGSEDKVKTKV